MQTDFQPRSCNIAAALPEMAVRQADAIAIRCPSGTDAQGRVLYDTVLTYAELEARSNAIAAALARAGIRRGSAGRAEAARFRSPLAAAGSGAVTAWIAYCRKAAMTAFR